MAATTSTAPTASTTPLSPSVASTRSNGEKQLYKIASSYIHESFDDKYNDFNVILSNWIIIISFGILMGILAFKMLKYYWQYIEEEERIVPFVLFTISAGIGLSAALLLPLTIFTQEISTSYPNAWFFLWLNPKLISGLVCFGIDVNINSFVGYRVSYGKYINGYFAAIWLFLWRNYRKNS